MKKNYVDNSVLIDELKKYKNTCKYCENGCYVKNSGQITTEFAVLIQEIITGLANRPNFRSYTWRDDMINNAIVIVLKYIHNFDITQPNPFGYISMIAYRSFLQTIKAEKKNSKIKQFLFDKKPTKYFENNEFYNTIALDYEEIRNWESVEDIDEILKEI
jgi:hypothetical protein